MKKSLLNIISLVLIITNTILTGIMVIVIVPSMQDSNRIIKKVAQAINLELDTSQKVNMSDVPLDKCETYDLDTKLTISMKKGADGKDHYAVIYPALLLYKDGDNFTKNHDILTEKKAIVTQHIQDVVQKYTATELQSDPNTVRQEVLKDLQGIFGNDFIVQVVFGTTTIQ